jgi:hypothetical protein
MNPKEFQELFIIVNMACKNPLPAANIIQPRRGSSNNWLVIIGVNDIAAILKNCINKY